MPEPTHYALQLCQQKESQFIKAGLPLLPQKQGQNPHRLTKCMQRRQLIECKSELRCMCQAETRLQAVLIASNVQGRLKMKDAHTAHMKASQRHLSQSNWLHHYLVYIHV